MKTTIALSTAALLALTAPAFAGGHSQVAADMVDEITATPGAAKAASTLKGGWGNRDDDLTGGTLGPAQVTGKPPKASPKAPK